MWTASPLLRIKGSLVFARPSLVRLLRASSWQLQAKHCHHRSMHSGALGSTPQAFGGSVLNRSVNRKDNSILSDQFASSVSAIITSRHIAVHKQENASGGTSAQLCWFTAEQLAQLGLSPATAGVPTPDDRKAGHVLPLLLGQQVDTGRYAFALDATAYEQQDRLAEGLQVQGCTLSELRPLMAQMAMEELAVAGHAVALAQWHQGHGFCGRCGAPSEPVELGAKRQCTQDEKHREYPRTDPVAIMMVESVNGTKALLGRSRTIRLGTMLTCLSGFIEQGESIEEAVRREVLEESGIEVEQVAIVGSQPWPIGRGGSCELMIGCIARARGDDVHFDPEEMDDVQWVGRDEVLKAVADSKRPDTPYLGGSAKPTPPNDFWIPPPTAIAHHLINAWASKGAPWFPSNRL